ncbi:MAG TPA: RNA methyltransferase [Granulicella sp.]|jgi:TrmH family RNA methyltransferase
MILPQPIISRTNARVKALRAALSGRASQPGELLGIEGENLIAEAMRSHIPFDTVYVREGSENVLERPALKDLQSNHWAVLSRDVFESAVDTASPQGIAATFNIPQLTHKDALPSPGVVLVLEDIQDPGNFGTLIRSAEAFQISTIYVTSSTVNQWNPKAVRASAGSVFRIPIVRGALQQIQGWLTAGGTRLHAAVADAEDAISVMQASLLAPCAIMIGNEGAGLSATALNLADDQVNIPCFVESLNAAIAGSTLMYESFRQNLQRTSKGTQGQL